MPSNGSVEISSDIAARITPIRGHRVLVDADLASLYGVATKRLNEQVRRNQKRFPADFAFRLTAEEANALRSQNATSSGDALNRSQFATGYRKHRNPQFRPWAFREHGAIMVATVLNSSRAVEMSLYVVRAFVQLRGLLASNTELARRLDELERLLKGHDDAITAILSVIRELTYPREPKRGGIGFTAEIEPRR